MTIPDGYGQLSFVHQGAGIEGEAVVTFGFRNDAGQSASLIADGAGTLWIPVVEATCVEQITFTETRCKLGPDATGAFAQSGFNNPGDQGLDPAAPQLAMLVAKLSALGGRRGRGRSYVPGPPDVLDHDTGLWDAGYVTQVQTAFEDFGAAMSLADWVPVILHEGNTTPTPITAYAVRSRSGTQRRRNRR